MVNELKRWAKMIEIKKIDSQGRVILPAKWRNKLPSNEIVFVEDGNNLLIIPKDDPDLSKYIDSIKIDIPSDKFSDYKLLKNFLLSGD